jgi:hypothetical protein
MPLIGQGRTKDVEFREGALLQGPDHYGTTVRRWASAYRFADLGTKNEIVQVFLYRFKFVDREKKELQPNEAIKKIREALNSAGKKIATLRPGERGHTPLIADGRSAPIDPPIVEPLTFQNNTYFSDNVADLLRANQIQSALSEQEGWLTEKLGKRVQFITETTDDMKMYLCVKNQSKNVPNDTCLPIDTKLVGRQATVAPINHPIAPRGTADVSL